MNMHLMLLATNLVYLRRSLGVPALVCALAILLAFLPAAPADAGLNEWTTNGPASSGPILSLAVDPSAPETVYAGSGISGMLAGTVFKSTNGGVSWVPANSGLPSVFARSLVIDPQTPSTIYAGTSAGVFKSTNGGGNWGAVNSGLVVLSVMTLAMDPQNPAILYAGTTAGSTNGVFKSINSGVNWTPVGTGLPNGIVSALAVDPQTSSTVMPGPSSDCSRARTAAPPIVGRP
jgi:photosystem II stability/assembly factor-like uncharacterized protein